MSSPPRFGIGGKVSIFGLSNRDSGLQKHWEGGIWHVDGCCSTASSTTTAGDLASGPYLVGNTILWETRSGFEFFGGYFRTTLIRLRGNVNKVYQKANENLSVGLLSPHVAKDFQLRTESIKFLIHSVWDGQVLILILQSIQYVVLWIYYMEQLLRREPNSRGWTCWARLRTNWRLCRELELCSVTGSDEDPLIIPVTTMTSIVRMNMKYPSDIILFLKLRSISPPQRVMILMNLQSTTTD